jgi:hypothetical protein
MYPILCPVNYARTYSLKKLDYGICVVRAAFTPVGAGRAAVRVTAARRPQVSAPAALERPDP